MRDSDEKTRMKAWSEESYDYTAEVQEAIDKIPESKRFPCVCLDLTLAFVRPETDRSDEDTDDQPITTFSRDELLEIGRSCDWRILRRLGKVLTRLTYIHSADEMPSHIAAVSESEVPRIPMALASQEYGRRFWRILLHIVVPGTVLSARPAALLAALTIKLGMQPLIPAAVQEMKSWRAKWNDPEIHETWNVNCLCLLVDADKARETKEHEVGHSTQGGSLLLQSDRTLFERLVDYKMLEFNLGTTLTAKIGWTPNRATMPIGPVAMCKSCAYPRSVTVMGPDRICGICLCDDFEDAAEEAKVKSTRVSKSDNELSNAVWYECSTRACRAQYVVYNVELLNVRPKCHYCRQQSASSGGVKLTTNAPTVKCTRCLSRMIWPLEYRPNEGMLGWECMACTAGKKTVVDRDATAAKLIDKNGHDWVLRNDGAKFKSPFNGRSLYNIVSSSLPLDDFTSRVQILPAQADEGSQLFYHGKLVRNTAEVLEQLYSWISR